jgi:hypothetical protein
MRTITDEAAYLGPAGGVPVLLGKSRREQFLEEIDTVMP